MAERAAPHSAWWLYVVLLCGISALSLMTGPSSPLEFALGMFNLFALAGLWGYIRQVAVGWQPVWAAYFVLSLMLGAVPLVLMLIDPGPSLGLVVALGFSSALVLPLYLALWRYAFRSPAVWAPDAA